MPYTHEQRTKLLLIGLIHCPNDLKDIPLSVKNYIAEIKNEMIAKPALLTDIINAIFTMSNKIAEISAIEIDEER